MENEKPVRVVIRRSPKELLRRIAGNLAHWVGGQILIAFILTVFYAVGFWAVGLPWWPFFAVVNGFFHLIPMVGASLGLLLPFLGWVFLTNMDPYTLLGVILVYAVAQGVEGFYLTPKILGVKLQLKPFLVFLALIIGSSFFGFFGALFAAPVLAIAMTIWRWWYEHQQEPAGPQKS